MNKTIMISGIAAVLAVGVAVAAPGDRAARIDPNGDGVSIAEMQQHMAERFKRLDANADGQVTRAEFDTTRADRGKHHGGRRGHKGHDGGWMFERLDANKDGQISRAEFDAARAQRAERRSERGHGGPRGGRFFERVDADGNGAVTLAEFTSGVAGRVARLDSNKDGKVSREEFTAGRGHKGHRGEAE